MNEHPILYCVLQCECHYRYLIEFSDSAGREEFYGKLEAENIIGNPLQAFQLVKRLTINWGNIKDRMNRFKDWNSNYTFKMSLY